jgi:histidinol-phosphate aminotransferase
MVLQVPEYIRTLVPYVPGKPIEETQREYKIKKVIKLASNENPLGPSPKARKVIQSHLKNLHRYPDASGFRLKQALSHHLKIKPESIILGNGSNEVIDQIIRTYCIPGDAIATYQTAFVAYKICAQIHGVRTVEVPVDAELKWDPQALLDLVRKEERVKAVFIANPNNPTGTYTKTPELKAFLKELSQIRNGSVLAVLDYAYWEYVTAKDLPDPLPFLSEFSNLVILRTFSKIHGLAGLRVGYGIASPELISNLEKVRQPFNLNNLALAAAESALSDTVFIKKSKRMNQIGLQFWEKKLTQMNVPFWKSQGNFILIDVQKGFGKTGPEIQQQCLTQGVIFRPVANYGLPHALRITIGTPSENLRAAQVLFPTLAKSKSVRNQVNKKNKVNKKRAKART